jgi:hypothetical protein
VPENLSAGGAPALLEALDQAATKLDEITAATA